MLAPRATPRLARPASHLAILVAALLAATACSGKRGGGGAPLTTGGDPRLLELAVEPTADRVLADELGELAVRIRVSAARLPPGDRPPLNLTLVLDTSGSMEGAAIEEEKRAARTLVEKLTPRDRVALVIFHSTAEVLVESTRVDDGARRRLARAIDDITARGTTDLASGLALGLQQAAAGRVPGSIDRVVLLGDGVPNDPSALPGLVAGAVAQRLSITTLGLGIEFDEVLLGQIARDTGGRYHYLDEPGQVAAVFEDELLQMRQVVGKNLALELVAGPGVTLEPLGGFQPMGKGLYAVLGDLTAGEIRDVVVPLRVVGRRDGAVVELVDATLTFEDATRGAGGLRRTGFARVRADADPAAVAASVKVAIELARARARAASAILDAIARARAADLAGALAVIDAALVEARTTAERTGDAELLDLAARMELLRADLPELAAAAQRALQVHGHGAGAMPSPAAAAPEAVERRTRDAHRRAVDVVR
ncbi:MAG: VWA domain-containing protein [Kofleriaceae bacterium]|nr:VWA domain-containing protein [Kofleriaceae bacterium]MCL4228110.1 VWA domain-containing protein [Myxococcales bacterium]